MLQLQGITQEVSDQPADVKPPLNPNSMHFRRKYGLQPKFVRMRELHLLLFYLTRSYDAQVPAPYVPGAAEARAEIVTAARANAGAGWDESVERDVAEGKVEVYRKEIEWRTFIPPLPQHEVTVVDFFILACNNPSLSNCSKLLNGALKPRICRVGAPAGA